MRRLVVVLLAVATAVVVGAGPASACSEAPNAYVVAGEATAIDGGQVTYRVDEVVGVLPDDPGPVPGVGDAVTVSYHGDDARFVHLGERYRVGVVTDGGMRVSWIRSNGDDCGPGRTSHIDGAPLNTGVLGPDGFRAWPGAIPLGVAAVLVVVAVVVLVRARRRRRVPRAS